MDDDLNVDDGFFGFYEIDSIKSGTVVKAIKDILVRCSLSSDDCRDRTAKYYGESWGNLRLSEVFFETQKKMLGKLTENVEGTFDFDELQPTKLDKLCVTRWTFLKNCMKKFIDNYDALLKLWKESLEERLDAETKSTIIDCSKEMKSLNSILDYH